MNKYILALIIGSICLVPLMLQKHEKPMQPIATAKPSTHHEATGPTQKEFDDADAAVRESAANLKALEELSATINSIPRQ